MTSRPALPPSAPSPWPYWRFLAVYGPGSVLTGRQVLLGVDHVDLHARRMAFAREALWARSLRCQAGTHESFSGRPFWSNTQNFPFLPTRLAVFLAFQPDVAFFGRGHPGSGSVPGLHLALRHRLGMSGLAAVVAGFTFACSGFYASRVMVGHLPLLEVFPSLPLLLWLTDRVVRQPEPASSASPWKRLLALALASGCLALAGHPQLVIYSLATATAYAWVMGSRGRAALSSLASLLGVGCASVVLVPMMLLAGRSAALFPQGREPPRLAREFNQDDRETNQQQEALIGVAHVDPPLSQGEGLAHRP